MPPIVRVYRAHAAFSNTFGMLIDTSFRSAAASIVFSVDVVSNPNAIPDPTEEHLRSKWILVRFFVDPVADPVIRI